MSIFGKFLSRPYETVASIKGLTEKEILNISPNQISTTKIIEDDEFKTLPEAFQNAVKYIVIRKRLAKNRILPYENIEADFAYKNQNDLEVSKLIDETSVEINLENQRKKIR